jgi:peptide/nickel transport system permease protein
MSEVRIAEIDFRRGVGEPSRARRVVGAIGEFYRYRPLAGFGALVILVLGLMAAVPQVFATHDPVALDYGATLKGPSGAHWFGTDNFGRDIYSRVVFGARTSVLVGLGATFVGVALATVIGLVCGFLGGAVDAVLQRVVDGAMALPWLVVLMSIMALIGPGVGNVILAVGILSAPSMSRVVRAAVLRLRASTFVEAARAVGATDSRIVLRYVLPNITSELIVLASVAVGTAILAESTLSFLGFGVVPPEPSWGYMLSVEGRRFMYIAPWLAIFPGAAVAVTVFAMNMFGDGLRDALDPRLRGER